MKYRLTDFGLGLLLILVSLSLLAVGCRHIKVDNDTPDSKKPSLTIKSPADTAAPLRREILNSGIGLIIALEFAPDGRLFYAEKTGDVYTQVVLGGDVEPPTEILSLDVADGNENGLLGLALSPDFAQTGYFYVYYNVPDEAKAPIGSRIVRYREANNQIVEEKILIELPASPEQQYHFGGGLGFGPDGKLYLIFGDRNMPEAARDPAQLPGSVLRYNPDGTIPDDNPFPNSPVYAYGIRNGFGLAWHPQTGQLYETENGVDCDDELNLILPGTGYGWGLHVYDTCPYPDDSQPPLYQWTPVVAPTDLMFYTGDQLPEFRGDLLVCGFNQSKLFQFHLSEDGRSVVSVTPVEIPGVLDLCRVSLVQGPDGWIYAGTSRGLHRIGR